MRAPTPLSELLLGAVRLAAKKTSWRCSDEVRGFVGDQYCGLEARSIGPAVYEAVKALETAARALGG